MCIHGAVSRIGNKHERHESDGNRLNVEFNADNGFNFNYDSDGNRNWNYGAFPRKCSLLLFLNKLYPSSNHFAYFLEISLQN